MMVPRRIIERRRRRMTCAIIVMSGLTVCALCAFLWTVGVL